MNNSHYYHCATKGLNDDLLFPSVKGFIAGMNRVASCFVKAQRSSPVLIFAFCLMDNHVHFILYGTEENCRKFMISYKTMTEIWFKNNPDEGSGGKNWDMGFWLIPDKEALKEKIVYVLRNPMAAAMPYLPTNYRWSSASSLFTDKSFVKICTVELGTISIRHQRSLFCSHEKLPQDWLVYNDGMIWPGCYTECLRVENLFKTAASFTYELNKKVEAKVNEEMMDDFVSLPDNEIREKAIAFARSMYGKNRIADLNVRQRKDIASILKKETGTSSKQLARIVRLKHEDLKQLI